jgi:hypothetical protein
MTEQPDILPFQDFSINISQPRCFFVSFSHMDRVKVKTDFFACILISNIQPAVDLLNFRCFFYIVRNVSRTAHLKENCQPATWNQ